MDNKIKILHIVPSLLPGGAEKMAVDLAKFADRGLFSVEVLCLRAGGIWEEELRRAQIPFTVIGSLRHPIIFDFFKIVGFIRAFSPDIVQTHLFGADFYGRLAAKLAGVKRIISTEQNLNWNENWLKKIAKYWTAKLAVKIVAASGAIKKYLIDQEGVEAGKIEVIYNGVEIEKFLNNSRAYEATSPVVGTIGRLTRQKGFDYLLKSVANIPEIEVLIAGEGEERESLLQGIKELGLERRVKLVGVRKDVAGFLNSLDIFVLPSRWEGFGIVILEAGLSGLPVIASGVDGILEIISDNEDGLLFAPGNSEDLAAKLKKLLSDPAERARLGKNLQRKVADKFDIKKTVKQYEELYQKIMN
ncbi:MAG: glycosyltransferase [Patescibacteria group bacterium]|nr:glycosyltransferase [Patescibacteria group bacterium]